MSAEITKQMEIDSGLALLLITLLTIYFTEELQFIPAAIVILVFIMSWPKVYRPFAFVWFGLSKTMGEIVSRILLTITFILIAIPIGYIRRLMGFDSMRLKFPQNECTSYFKDRNHTFTADDIKNPY